MKRNGFTLVELLVVIGISAILFSLATMEFRRSSAKTAVESALRSLSGELTAARTQALFQKKDIAVRITSTTFYLYSSAVVTATPARTSSLPFRVALNSIPDPIIFTTRGVIDGIDNGSICIEPNNNEGAIDSLLLTTTRIRTGKRNAGTACTKDNIVIQ